MASATSEQRAGRVVDEEEHQLVHHREQGVVDRREVSKRVSRLAVEGGVAGMMNESAGRGDHQIGGGGGSVDARSSAKPENDAMHGRRLSGIGGRTLPPPHAWLAIEDTKTKHCDASDDDPEEQWMRLLNGGRGSRHQHQQRRSSFSVVRRERAAREAWLDHAWEMKRSWHARNGGAPDAETPVVVVVGKGHAAESEPSDSPPSAHHHHHHAAGAVGGGGVAMDVEEVRACRELGLELPSDCTVEIQCYGLSDGGGGSPTHTAGSSSGADSLCAGISSPGADPIDVKARLKVWAQAVALTSTTQLGS